MRWKDQSQVRGGSESSDLRREKPAHVIVLIFSLLLDAKLLQGGVDVQLVGLQLPQKRFSLNTQKRGVWDLRELRTRQICPHVHVTVRVRMLSNRTREVKAQPVAAGRGC